MSNDTTNKYQALDSWEFIERYYSGYSSCNKVAYCNDLYAYQKGEIPEDEVSERLSHSGLLGAKINDIVKEHNRVFRELQVKALEHFFWTKNNL